MRPTTTVAIRAALAGQTTGLLAKEMRKRGSINDAAACMGALMQMKKTGEIVSHDGDTPRSTRYRLNPAFAGAQGAPGSAGGGRRKARKKKPAKARKTRKVKPTASIVEQEFIPAITADSSLVCITAGMLRGWIFSPAETLAIATLLGNHFG